MVRIEKPEEEYISERLEEFRGNNWIGRPEDSVEFEVTGENYPLKAPGVVSLNNHLTQPILVAGFRGVTEEDYNDLKDSEKDIVREIDEELIDNEFYPVPDRMDKIYDELGIPYQVETFNVEFGEISETIEDALLLERGLDERDDFQIKSAVVSGKASGNDLKEAYENLQENTSLTINFQYNPSENPDIVDFGSITVEPEGYIVNTPGITGPAELGINLRIQQIYLDYVESDEARLDFPVLK